MKTPVFFHVDMDAFFASVEQRDAPELRGKPVIVGAAPGRRGVVSACSYEARAFGVHSAMPISEAYRLCPSGVFLPVRMERYHEISERIMSIFAAYSPHVQQMSVDEAFLDMTGTERLLGAPLASGARLKGEVRESERLAISVGIANNRYLAKLASARSKPDGLLQVDSGQVESFLDSIRLKDLWGVGKKTLERLDEVGIETVADLRAMSIERLRKEFGEGGGAYLHRICRGGDPGFFEGPPKSRSVSSETTFETDIADRDILKTTILELCYAVTYRMHRAGEQASTVSIKLRLWDFRTTSAQTTLRHPVRSAEELHRVACTLLDRRWDGTTPVRLIGVGMDRVVPDASEEQPELFQRTDDRARKIEQTAIDLEDRFGSERLRKASLLRPRPGIRRRGPDGRGTEHEGRGTPGGGVS